MSNGGKKNDKMEESSVGTSDRCHTGTYGVRMWEKDCDDREYRQFKVQSLYDHGCRRHYRPVI